MATRVTNNDAATEISAKLNVLIALSTKHLLGEKSFERAGKRGLFGENKLWGVCCS